MGDAGATFQVVLKKDVLGDKAMELFGATADIGDFVGFTGQMMESPQHRNRGYSMAHEAYFERMKREGLYTTDVASIHRRIRDLGLTGVLARKLV